MAFVLMSAGGLTLSVVMLRTRVFNRAAAYTGILANAATLIYCAASLVMPFVGLLFLWLSGLLFLIWMIVAGWRLLSITRESQTPPAERMS
jgi:hypothetical protein